MKAIILSAIESEIHSLNTEYEIILTGVGKVNAALSAMKTIREKRPDLIINFGTAGSLKKEISGLVASGLSDEQISNKLSIAKLTVKTHLRNIYSKTGIHDRANLAIRVLNSDKA